MKDRVSLYPGRVTLTPVEGQANTYDLVRADQATQAGTPLNKASLLTDETEVALFGDAADRTVNQAFVAIISRFRMLESSTAAVTVTVKDSSGLAAKGVEVAGMFSEDGGAVYTDNSGVASGYVPEGSVTLSISRYADVADASDTFTAIAGGRYTRAITVTRRTYLKLLSSAFFRFSGNVATVDVALGGGGAGGQAGQGQYSSTSGGARRATGGGGGGAGRTAEQTGIAPEINTVYSAIVGAGGEAGAAGGASSFLGVSAAGGAVNGGGRGARYQLSASPLTASAAGADGTGTLYASMSETFLFGGDGGGGGASNGNLRVSGYDSAGDSGSSGGGPGGGKGGDGTYGATATEGSSGTDGLGGGGGGGASRWVAETSNYASRCDNWGGGKGGGGCITMRIHLETA